MDHIPVNATASSSLPGILRPFERPSRLIGAGVILMLAVVLIGFILKTRVVTAVDLGVDSALSRAHVAPMTSVSQLIYLLFSPPGAIAITIVVALIIWAASRNWRVALTFSVIVGASWVSSAVVKLLVHRPRPDASVLLHPYLPTPPDASFPSGHVVFATSLAIALMFLARNTARVKTVVVLGIVGPIMVGVAVVYLGVHYPTDVIASLLWAVGACPLVLALWNRFVIPRITRVGQTPIEK